MQLDMFAERRGPAEVLAFPVAKRRSSVVFAVEELCRRSHDEGRTFWNSHLRALRASLRKGGLSSTVIASEVEAYTIEVTRLVILFDAYGDLRAAGLEAGPHRQTPDASIIPFLSVAPAGRAASR